MSRFLLTIIIIFNFRNSYGAEGKGGMPQLNPESFSSQLFWLLIFFTFLFFIVNSIFIPKIKKIREKRDETIDKLLSESKSINQSMENIIHKINDEMDKEKENSNFQINKAINENKAILDKKISSLDEEFEKKREVVTKELTISKTKIEKKIPEIIVVLSDQIFEKILGEKSKSSINDFEKFQKDYK